jgi:hypothetical protein
MSNDRGCFKLRFVSIASDSVGINRRSDHLLNATEESAIPVDSDDEDNVVFRGSFQSDNFCGRTGKSPELARGRHIAPCSGNFLRRSLLEFR